MTNLKTITIPGTRITMTPEQAAAELGRIQVGCTKLALWPRSADAWEAWEVRCWNGRQYGVATGVLVPGSDRYRAITACYEECKARREVGRETGGLC